MLGNITPVPNQVFDLHLNGLRCSELKVLLVVIRQTLGWEDEATKSKRKESDWISTKQLEEKTGCSKRGVVAAVSVLLEKKLISVLDEHGNILDTPDKRKGKQKLIYRIADEIFPPIVNKKPVEKKGKTPSYQDDCDSTYVENYEDLCKKRRALAQKTDISSIYQVNPSK